MSAHLDAQGRLDALLDRFSPRLAPDARALARDRLRNLVATHPRLPSPQLAGHAAVALSDLLADASLFADARALEAPPAVLAPERALGLARARAASAPPELVDGPPIRWAREETGIGGPLALWRARRERGPAPGERLFAYVHVPFCRTRCAFCQFESVVDPRDEARRGYVQAVQEEAEALRGELGVLEADAITIGGGTPSELATPLLAEVLAALRSLVTPRAGAYVSVELNPDSATEDRVALLASAGVTRVSMGVQSFDAATLHAVARGYQSAAMVEDAVARVRARPGLSLGLDLLAPLPHETLASFDAGLARALALAPDELVLYRYQPVLRGTERTISPGALPYEQALDLFEARALGAGYVLVPHTGSSRVARAPGATAPEPRYVQHPREPTTILGLGPHAESHVFGHGRYVALDLAQGPRRYRVEPTDPALERSLLVARRLAAGLAIDEHALGRATGGTLADTHPEAVGYFAARDELEVCDAQLTPRWPAREDAQRASWAFVDPRVLRGLALAEDGAMSSLLAQLDRARLWPEAPRPATRSSPADERTLGAEARVWLSARGTRRAALVGSLAIDDLLVEESDLALRAFLGAIGLRAAAAVARLLVDRVLADALVVSRGPVSTTLALPVRVPAPAPLGWLLEELGAPATSQAEADRSLGGLATLTALRAPLGDGAEEVSLVRTLAPDGDAMRVLARRLAPSEPEALRGSRVHHVVGARSGAQTLELQTETPALVRAFLERRAPSLAAEADELSRTLGAELDGVTVPLDEASRPRLDAIEVWLRRPARARRRLPSIG